MENTWQVAKGHVCVKQSYTVLAPFLKSHLSTKRTQLQEHSHNNDEDNNSY